MALERAAPARSPDSSLRRIDPRYLAQDDNMMLSVVTSDRAEGSGLRDTMQFSFRGTG